MKLKEEGNCPYQKVAGLEGRTGLTSEKEKTEPAMCSAHVCVPPVPAPEPGDTAPEALAFQWGEAEAGSSPNNTLTTGTAKDSEKSQVGVTVATAALQGSPHSSPLAGAHRKYVVSKPPAKTECSFPRVHLASCQPVPDVLKALCSAGGRPLWMNKTQPLPQRAHSQGRAQTDG